MKEEETVRIREEERRRKMELYCCPQKVDKGWSIGSMEVAPD
jgi:hypothetical protein